MTPRELYAADPAVVAVLTYRPDSRRADLDVNPAHGPHHGGLTGLLKDARGEVAARVQRLVELGPDADGGWRWIADAGVPPYWLTVLRRIELPSTGPDGQGEPT